MKPLLLLSLTHLGLVPCQEERGGVRSGPILCLADLYRGLLGAVAAWAGGTEYHCPYFHGHQLCPAVGTLLVSLSLMSPMTSHFLIELDSHHVDLIHQIQIG